MPQRGRQTQLAQKLKVSQQAASKWLGGVTYPEMDRAIELAELAGVNVAWLLQGIGPKRGSKIDAKVLELGEAIGELEQDERQLVLDFIEFRIHKSPLIVGEKMARYMKMIDAFKRTTKRPPAKGS